MDMDIYGGDLWISMDSLCAWGLSLRTVVNVCVQSTFQTSYVEDIIKHPELVKSFGIYNAMYQDMLMMKMS